MELKNTYNKILLIREAIQTNRYIHDMDKIYTYITRPANVTCEQFYKLNKYIGGII